ncbi:MAG: hypothetical protein A2Y62_02740 [Candidatus Fischerbacteria bacterium RBG_13_37_8]|uniref:Phosphatidylserine decarboxylase n=1 Tax=Candidatus Fischerbacteria bacterium RBG_13_37_8 TaxID=1817863 RepID=A0A1F5VXZ4_9BACT|nr:MAG: hypothetical protein A2Y62_02740 [Candidatus Fischerbacteria bacterium RBG_13_37_8]
MVFDKKRLFAVSPIIHMINVIILLFETIVISTLLFALLVKKAKIKKNTMYHENIFIIIISFCIQFILIMAFHIPLFINIFIINPIVVSFSLACLTVFYFYRDPHRTHNAALDDILSPADGFILYIKEIENNEIPISVKGKAIFKLKELMKTDIVAESCWLVGIVMTLFDVHVNRSPCSGKIICNEYFKGKFLSLKKAESELENERHTIVIENDLGKIAIIRIASKRVRGIRTYVTSGQNIETGQKIGKIVFGSQTDIVIPFHCEIKVEIGKWVQAGKTIIATKKKKITI